jgi:biopolymer transport protein ExbB
MLSMNCLVNAVELLARGGYVMIPLLICSIISVAVMIERWAKIRAAQCDVSESVNRAERELYKGNFKSAIDVLESTDSPVSRVLAAGVKNAHLGERSAERAMEEQGNRETHKLTRGLGSLDTIVTIAPLLGLLGTVTGMISAFHVIAAKEGISTPTAITGGVAEALIATATGLAIAICTLVGYNHLQERIKCLVAEMEARGSAMVNVLVDARGDSGEIESLSA